MQKRSSRISAAASLCQRRAIFPGRRQPSIVATDELNFRVRNGNGWTLIVIGTDFVVADLTGCASCGYRKGRIKLACVRSLLLFKLKHPLQFECGGRVLCTLKTEQRFWTRKDLSLLFLRTCRLSPRAISTGQLNTLLCLHLRPIYQIVSLGPYSLEEMGDLILGGVSRLDAFSVYLVRT